QKSQVLQLFVRDVAKADDPDTSKFIPVFGYLGSWGSESSTTKTESNSDDWFWWVGGAHVDQIKTIHRSLRTGGLAGEPNWQLQGSVELDAVRIFDSHGVFGEAARDFGLVCKAAVDITGGVMAAGIAESPAM